MPDELADQTVSKEEFLAFQHAWRSLRRLDVGLDFLNTAKGRVTGEDLAWVFSNVLGRPLSDTQARGAGRRQATGPRGG